MHSVIETPSFTRRADALLSRDERKALIDTLAGSPLAGDLIPGMGGVRKLRFAARGRGKSGSFRVIYYFLHKNQPIFALLVYGKNEQSDLSPAQRKTLGGLAADMKRSAQ